MPLLSTRARAACSEPVGVRPTVGTVKRLGEDYTDMPGPVAGLRVFPISAEATQLPS